MDFTNKVDNEYDDKVSELTNHGHTGRAGGQGPRHKTNGHNAGTVGEDVDLDDSIITVGNLESSLHRESDSIFNNPAYERSYSRSRTRHRPINVPPPEEAAEPQAPRTISRWGYAIAVLVFVCCVGAILTYMLLASEVEHPANSLENIKPIQPQEPLYLELDSNEPMKYVEYIFEVGFEKNNTSDGDTAYVDVEVAQRANDSAQWEVIEELGKDRNYHYGSELLDVKGSFDLTCKSCNGPELALRFTSNSKTATSMSIHIVQLGNIGRYQVVIAGLLLIIMYVAIAFDVLHRTVVALVGMFITLLFLAIMDKSPTLSEAFEWVDEGVLTLLLGMMIVVTIFGETGLFEYVAIRAYIMSKGSYLRLMITLTLATASLSAFLDTVTTMLLIAPVTIRLIGGMLKKDPRPLLLAECMMSNIGGTATMIGDPPNIIIGASLKEYLGFLDFIINLTPLAIIIFAVTIGLLVFLFREELRQPLQPPEDDNAINEYKIKKPQLLLHVSIIFFTMLILFFTEPVHHVDVAWTALGGAVAMLVLAHPHDIVDVLEVVEWDTLVFFSALFIMIEGLAEMGLIRAIGDTLRDWIEACPPGSQLAVAILILLWVSGLASAFLDNIPYTTTMVPVVLTLANSPELDLPVKPLAWAVALSACLGGNGTLIGSSANVVTAGLASRAGYNITFMYWFKIGFPVLLLSLVVSTTYTMILYVAIGFGG